MPMKTVRANGVRPATSGSGPTLSYTTGLTLWFKADALVLNDGDAVTTWADSSGNGYDLSQSVAGEKPTYKTGILNGKPVVRFDGGDILNRDTTQIPLRTHSFFVVFRESSTVSSAGIVTIKTAAGNDYERNDGISAETFDNTGYIAIGCGAPTRYAVSGGSSGASPWGVYSHVMATTTGTLYLNGSAAATDSTFSTPDANSAGGFLVGGRFLGGAISGGYRLNGDVAELLWYNTNLDTSARQTVERYLGAKYGITVA